MRTTAPLVAIGLVGGYATAAASGIRPLGGAVLLAAGALAARGWVKDLGVGPAVGLGAVYLGAFAASHPLAPQIGAWPSVAVVTAAATGITLLVESRRTTSRSA